MAATFGSLNLEELGVVGSPEVQYAKFETELSQPKGYDGGVLANFRRGATTIKFNLTLDGTQSEITNKMSALAYELAKGQGRLVLPNMTSGAYFEASANCAIKPDQYIDGFVLPLEFVVPDGCAKKELKSVVSALDGSFNVEGYFEPNIHIHGQRNMTVSTGQYGVGISTTGSYSNEYINAVVKPIDGGPLYGLVEFDFDGETGVSTLKCDGEIVPCSFVGEVKNSPLKIGQNKVSSALGILEFTISWSELVAW